MSNDKMAATFHAPPLGPPGVLGPPPSVPPWADLAAQHGWTTARHEDQGDGRPWTSPGTPPWVAERRADKRVVLAVVLFLLTVLVFALGIIVQHLNILPVGVPLIGKDSGVAACQAIAEGNSPTGAAGQTMTQDQYVELRGVFADSRYPAIRDNGAALIDVAWQIQGLGTDPGLGILVYVQQMTSAYSGLTGGCAEHGYTLPALTAN